MTAHLYARVSTTQQTEGFSLQAQKERMQAYCTYQGHQNTQHWEDAGISGKRDDRPALTGMLHALQKGDTVIVYSLSRLGRGGAIQTLRIVEQIQRKGAHLVSLTENIDTSTPTGKLVLTILAGIAELEVETTKDRSIQGRIQSVKSGRVPLGNQSIPYGYRKDNGGLTVHPEEAQTVRRIYQLASTPLGKRRPGMQTITELLTREGWAPPPGAKDWHMSTVFRILRNPAYHGEGIFNAQGGRTPIKMRFPPLIDKPTWDLAQPNRGSKHNHSDPEAFPLSGLVSCVHGVKIFGRWRRRGVPAPYRTYFVDSLKRQQVGCNCGTLQMRGEDLEGLIKTELLRVMQDPTDPIHLQSLTPTLPDEHDQTRRDLQAQRTNLLDLRQRGWIDLPEFEARMLTLQKALNALPAPQAPVINTGVLASLAEDIQDAEGHDLRDVLDSIEAQFILRPDRTVTLTSYRPLD